MVLYVAPGTYGPEKINLDKGPQYSLAGKGVPEKLNSNPGEWHLAKLFPRHTFLRPTINMRRKNLVMIEELNNDINFWLPRV